MANIKVGETGGISVIDFGAFLDGSRKQEVADAIVQSFKDVGFVYLINHRSPLDGKNPKLVGADSVIEIFQTRVTSNSLVHVATVQHPVISTPNDLVGYGDGKSFYLPMIMAPLKLVP